MPRHLIHVGFPKAGSTALSAWFDAHPQLQHRPNAIAGHYDAFGIAARAASDAPEPRWYVTSSESLSVPRVSDDPSVRPAGEVGREVPLPESRARVCRTLRDLFGDATILIVTRGFEGTILSGYSQYVKEGGHLAIAEMLAPRGRDPSGYLEYDAVIALYEETFGAENVIVLPYELLRDDAAAFTAALTERLGIDPGPGPVPARNVALSPAGLYWYRRLNRRAARLPGRVRPAWLRVVREDRLRRPLELLDRALPGMRDPGVRLPDGVLDALRGRAAGLATRPHYGPYAAEYLNERPAAATDSAAR
ncbi:MAG TPA: hypothetical protein VF587_08715 [Solirubrobacteraceae bacterium]|jgi:hypothetical protein